MASKQLGKLRQWAGEVISSRDKTTVSDEFRELERDIELRKDGVRRLQVASEAYHHVLVKKKDSEVVDAAEKLLPIDALGMVMILHGDEFPEDSAFGTSLVKFGRAHCKIATLQEAYATSFHETFLASVGKFAQDIKDYEVSRKKLESRRLSYDAAMSKLEKSKSGKKEKDKKDAEEEVKKAKLRYDEASDEVRALMHAIQENEIDQLRELTAFLDLEINFVSQYAEVLKDVKAEWCDNSKAKKFTAPLADEPLHVFARSTSGSKASTVRSRSSTKSDDEVSSSEEPDGEEMAQQNRQRSLGSHRSKPTSKSSRPSSTSSGKHVDSAGSNSAFPEKEKEKTEKLSRRLSVPGWASNAVGSVTGRAKRSKENFAALMGGGEEEESEEEAIAAPAPTSQPFSSFLSKKSSSTKSKESLGNPSPKPSAKILKPLSLQDKKIVRALYDFAGTSEELSFTAGDEIVVINEVLDEWWMGELNGRKGLFPTSYVEEMSAKPAIPKRPNGLKKGRAPSSPQSPGDDGSKDSSDAEECHESDLEDDHLFRADHLAPATDNFFGQSDVASIRSNTTEEEESPIEAQATLRVHSAPALPPRRDAITFPPSPSMRRPPIDITAQGSAPTKKPPPPPPPRRLTTSGLTSTNSGMDRPPSSFRSVSSSAVPMLTPTSSSTSSQEYDVSPFESATDFVGKGCHDFRQHPFKAKGMCSNCFASHV